MDVCDRDQINVFIIQAIKEAIKRSRWPQSNLSIVMTSKKCLKWRTISTRRPEGILKSEFALASYHWTSGTVTWASIWIVTAPLCIVHVREYTICRYVARLPGNLMSWQGGDTPIDAIVRAATGVKKSWPSFLLLDHLTASQKDLTVWLSCIPAVDRLTANSIRKNA